MSKSKRARDKARAEAHARRQCFCLDRTRTDSTGRLPCCLKHSHETCLVRWFDRTSTCPFCHTPLCPIYKNQPPLPVGHGLPFISLSRTPHPFQRRHPCQGHPHPHHGQAARSIGTGSARIFPGTCSNPRVIMLMADRADSSSSPGPSAWEAQVGHKLTMCSSC